MAEAALIQEARKNRSTAKSQFTRAEKSLSDALATEDVSASTIERRFQELKIKWNNVQDAHDTYASLQEGQTDGGNGDPNDNQWIQWIDELAERYDRIEVIADKRMDEITKNSISVPLQLQNPPVTVPTKSAVKIERLRYPPFAGDIRLYPQFKEEFLKHNQKEKGSVH